ncbi:MAG: efflux RND transporter periplasmic adaptor subunit [Acidobacteria bacterium]|nr:efflux RND transporter periplasmic adaptor subunit [Acidobacteriota bacterium]
MSRPFMEQQRKKRILYLASAITVGVGLLAGWFLWSRRGLKTVQATRVTRQDVTAIVTASGEIRPEDYVHLSASAFGRIVEIRVKEGEPVRKGQALAQLEAVQPAADVRAQQAQVQASETDVQSAAAAVESMQANVKTAEAALARARAQFERSRQDFVRAQSLSEEKLISRSSFEQAKADYDVAMAAVEEAEARNTQAQAQLQQATAQSATAQERVRQARANLDRLHDVLSKHTFYSPLNGVVTDLPVNVGENVVPGIQNSPGSLLMTIADLSTITAEVLVDETDIAAVQLGQRAEVKVDAFPERPFSGQVTEIGNTAVVRSTGLAAAQSTTSSQQAKDFKVVITLENPDANLRPGLSATAEIVTATRQQALAIPLQALTIRTRRELSLSRPNGNVPAAAPETQADELEGVFIVREGKAFFQPVTTGISGISDIEILTGLQEGDGIVAGSFEILRTLQSGDRVRIEETAANGVRGNF